MENASPGSRILLYVVMPDVFFSSGENGDAEYYEEFPIRLVHQFEGILKFVWHACSSVVAPQSSLIA